MSDASCGYAKHGDCSLGLTYIIEKYFIIGRSLRFCEKHGKEWNSLHPFGPIARKIKKENET